MPGTGCWRAGRVVWDTGDVSLPEQGEPGPQLCPGYKGRSWSLGRVSDNDVSAGHGQSCIATPLDGSCALEMFLCPWPGPCPPRSPGGEV